MMASLRKQPKGESWQLRVNLRKKPIVLSLSNLTEAQAERWKLFVQAIADRVELGKPLDRTILEWLSSLSSEQRKKLSDKGLIDPDEEEQPNSKEILLKDYLEEYFSSRKLDVKGSTWIFYQHTRKRLEEYFPGRSIQSITSIEAKQFRKWLEDSNKRDKPKEGKPAKSLAINTIKRRTGLCRQIFKQAIEDGLIARNPFAGMSTSVRSNKERKHYVDLGTFAKVLEKAPNARWRSLLVLARLAAFRIPSEAQGLKWEHIAWEAKRISIVGSSKTEHHADRQVRIVPMFPEIEKELLKLHIEAKDGAEYVFPELRADTNLRTTLVKIIRRAGVKAWPKLWQNLRSSAATDFARSVPSHIAAAICGHTEEVAQEHYWTVEDSDLDNVIEKLTPDLSQKLAIKLAIGDVFCGPESSLGVSTPMEGETKKAQEIPGFVALCQILSSGGFTLRMGEEGSEFLRISQGNSDLPRELAIKLANFDIQGLWESMKDEDKIAVLLFVDRLIHPKREDAPKGS
jgi:integrase